jgi:hypothetical protein
MTFHPDLQYNADLISILLINVWHAALGFVQPLINHLPLPSLNPIHTFVPCAQYSQFSKIDYNSSSVLVSYTAARTASRADFAAVKPERAAASFFLRRARSRAST